MPVDVRLRGLSRFLILYIIFPLILFDVVVCVFLRTASILADFLLLILVVSARQTLLLAINECVGPFDCLLNRRTS